MEFLSETLYEVSNAMLVPVIAVLLGLLVVVLVSFGRFLAEALERTRATRLWTAFRDRLMAAGDDRAELVRQFFDEPRWPELVTLFARRGTGYRARKRELESVSTECELSARRRVARMGLVARAGPTVGLMGTLIPMGPALVALAENDVSTMSRALVVAFTTTVVGLVIGLVASVITTTRRHWYAADLAAIETLVDELEPNR